MKLIREGLWSTTYQNCSVFVKRLNFWEPALAVREAYASRTVYCNGILTPKFLSIKVEQDKHISLQYNYVPMKELSNENILSNPALLAQLLELLNRLSKIPWEQNDEYWKNNIIKEGNNISQKQGIHKCSQTDHLSSENNLHHKYDHINNDQKDWIINSYSVRQCHNHSAERVISKTGKLKNCNSQTKDHISNQHYDHILPVYFSDPLTHLFFLHKINSFYHIRQ